MTARHTFALALAAAAFAPSFAFASDDAPAKPTAHAAPADNLGQARAQIAARQWGPALDELRRVNDTGSADWNNLMGFVLRKGKTPDLAGSEKYYDAALRIDPHHRNTLEYSGELCLMKGDLAKAQARLAALTSECGASCEQTGELKAAIDRYKAAGNKYVSTSW
ncbi:tetratricopeptide repeat protein [Scleromatobacter humisilvae]|uniref:Tetratricopeptide repeat protein n=1 Tax=Scleromatobacter humisilvae TaxID=2897159 RepID=A0A9X1YNF8_9BURK|nr:tetratricopeptide repeat protein [Scleromatobacter humisilvae]MCK9687607.1 tetratricopeptide repeat protein [Scleromatobacter humisilvae]